LNGQLHADFEKLIPKAVWNKIAQFAGAARTNSQNILYQAPTPLRRRKGSHHYGKRSKKANSGIDFWAIIWYCKIWKERNISDIEYHCVSLYSTYRSSPCFSWQRPAHRSAGSAAASAPPRLNLIIAPLVRPL
jgi:hypothetical protein